jgi:hypothetical protein
MSHIPLHIPLHERRVDFNKVKSHAPHPWTPFPTSRLVVERLDANGVVDVGLQVVEDVLRFSYGYDCET